MNRSGVLFLLLGLLVSAHCAGQAKLRKTYGIRSMTETTTPYENGVSLPSYISEYEVYNPDGQWIEKVDLLPDGSIKLTEKRVYQGDEIVEEIRDQPHDRNPQERLADFERQIHTYKKGEKLTSTTYSRDGSLLSTTFFSYNSFGDLLEKRTEFADGSTTILESYTYDDRGFKIEKRTERAGELVEMKSYLYE